MLCPGGVEAAPRPVMALRHLRWARLGCAAAGRRPAATHLRPASAVADRQVGVAPEATPLPAAAASPPPSPQRGPAAAAHARLQSVDYTVLRAAVAELSARWVPAKVEQAVQVDAQAAALRLRTLEGSTWLHISWAGTASYLSVGDAPERGAVAEAFAFGEQLNDGLRGLVLTDVSMPAAWERVVRLELAARPGDPPSRLLFHEVQGRYSNLLLCSGEGRVVAAAHQVRAHGLELRRRPPPRTNPPPPPPVRMHDRWAAK